MGAVLRAVRLPATGSGIAFRNLNFSNGNSLRQNGITRFLAANCVFFQCMTCVDLPAIANSGWGTPSKGAACRNIGMRFFGGQVKTPGFFGTTKVRPGARMSREIPQQNRPVNLSADAIRLAYLGTTSALGRVRSPSGPELQAAHRKSAVASEVRPHLPADISGPSLPQPPELRVRESASGLPI
jgi:hypothetical protein